MKENYQTQQPEKLTSQETVSVSTEKRKKCKFFSEIYIHLEITGFSKKGVPWVKSETSPGTGRARRDIRKKQPLQSGRWQV